MVVAQALVAVASVSFISTVFTRDAFFATAAVTAWWVFIIGQLTYGSAAPTPIDSLVWINYVLAAAVVAAVVGVVLVKLLGTGRLIDVWLTRSPLPLPYATEDWNVPVFLLAIGAAFMATFFIAQAVVHPLPIWPGGLVVAYGWAIAMSILFGLLTLVLVFSALVQRRTSHKGVVANDAPGVLYFFFWLLAGGIPLLPWLLLTSTAFARGAIAGGTAFVLDIVLLLIGTWFERWRVQRVVEAQTVGGGVADEYASAMRPYDGMFTGGSGFITAVRVFFIGLSHGLIFLFGGLDGLADIDTTAAAMEAAAKELFWFPYLALLFTIMLVVYGLVYVVIMLLFVTNAGERNELSYKYLSRAAPQGRVSPPVSSRGQTPAAAAAAVRATSPVTRRQTGSTKSQRMSAISFI